jgi:MFS family permease
MRRRPPWLTRNVLALGLVSLFTDTATDMVIPLLPAFLTTVLGAGAMALGWVEGVADAVSSLLKYLSGRWADRWRRNKPLVLLGYGLSTLARPFLGAAQTVGHVLLVRGLDRTGKGIRVSPRDALLAASVPPDRRGSAFGLHRAMDHGGAILGPLLAVLVLTFWTTDLRTLFWLSAIPGALAVAVILLGVKEQPAPATPQAPPRAPGGSLARFLFPLALFTLGNASDTFLLLKAGAVREPLRNLPLLWIALHAVKAATSLVGGRLADAWGKRRTTAAGWIVYAAIYAGFAFATDRQTVRLLFVLYGLYHGLSESAQKALVADLAPRGARGTAFGAYHLTLGGLRLAASLLFGYLWQTAGARSAFLVSAGLALGAVLLLAGLTRGSARQDRQSVQARGSRSPSGPSA